MDLTSGYQAIWIGHQAAEAVAAAFEAKVLGSTSRGIFLIGPDAQILFISYEAHSGPLSINLAALPPAGRLDARPNQKSWVAPDSIRLLSGEEVFLGSASTWQPPALPAARAGRAARTQAIREVAALNIEKKAEAGLAPLLAHILGLPARPIPDWQQPFIRAVAGLGDGSASGLLRAREPLTAVLGLGHGLTPSGDDFVCGLLLGLNRLAPCEQPPETHELSMLMAQKACRRTTALSAALIAAACLGSADQRLVTTWDGLLCASLSPSQIFQNLCAYGSSSGMDALAGFAAAASLINNGCVRQAHASVILN